VLITRLATAAVGIPLIVLVVWVGGALFTGVVAVAAAVAVIEIAMARGVARTPATTLSAVLAATLVGVALAGEDYLLGAVAGTIMLQAALMTLVWRPRDYQGERQVGAGDVEAWLWGIVMALYFGALAAHFVLLREAPNGRDLVFFTVSTVWITDTGAYFVGRAIGRHKLAPAVSPGKTWEGSFGSLIAGFAAVFGLNEAFGLGLALEHRIALGLLLPPVIMVGDLAESALKRGLGIKDSSGLVPGHGGVADRLDSLLFAAPLVYYYLRWVGYLSVFP